jgi:hypothetical protein
MTKEAVVWDWAKRQLEPFTARDLTAIQGIHSPRNAQDVLQRLKRRGLIRPMRAAGRNTPWVVIGSASVAIKDTRPDVFIPGYKPKARVPRPPSKEQLARAARANAMFMLERMFPLASRPVCNCKYECKCHLAEKLRFSCVAVSRA